VVSTWRSKKSKNKQTKKPTKSRLISAFIEEWGTSEGISSWTENWRV
jgi:hypothetical protein